MFWYRSSNNQEILWQPKCKSENTEKIKPIILQPNFIEPKTIGFILDLVSTEY